MNRLLKGLPVLLMAGLATTACSDGPPPTAVDDGIDGPGTTPPDQDPITQNGNLFYNLATSAAVEADVNGAYFEQVTDFANIPSTGTGNFRTFVQLSADKNTGTGVNEACWNTLYSFSGTSPYKKWCGSSDQFNHDIKLSAIPSTKIPAGPNAEGQGRDFRLDGNESNTAADRYYGLNALTVWVKENPTPLSNGNSGKFCDNEAGCPELNIDPDAADAGIGAVLVYDMDGRFGFGDAADRTVVQDFDLGSGSGAGDSRVIIPEDLFPPEALAECQYDAGSGLGSPDCDWWLVLYSEFGFEEEGPGGDPVATRDLTVDDGFEEWSVRKAAFVTVEKEVTTSVTKRQKWDLEKTAGPDWEIFKNDQAESDFDITFTKLDGQFEILQYTLEGTVTISNPSDEDAPIVRLEDFSDGTTLALGGDCEGLDPSEADPYVLPAGETLNCTFGPDVFETEPDVAENTVEVELDEGAVFSDVAPIDFDNPDNETILDQTATLSDLLTKADESEIARDFGSKSDDGTESYTETWTCDADAGTHSNVATLVGDDTGETYTAEASVDVACRELEVTKDFEAQFTRTYFWDIVKSGKKTGDVMYSEDPTTFLLQGEQLNAGVYVDYQISVDLTGTPEDSDWAVGGEISIVNPNTMLGAEITALSDLVSPDIVAGVDCGADFPITVAPEGTLSCEYSADLPDAENRTNTATATMQNKLWTYDGSVGSTDLEGVTTDYSGAADVMFPTDPTTEVDACIDVYDDTFGNGFLGNVCRTDALPATFQFQELLTATLVLGRDIVIPDDCDASFQFPNVGSIDGEDDRNDQTDDHTVTISIECPACTLTQGYWKTHNYTFKMSDGPPGPPSDDTWDMAGVDAEGTQFYLNGTWYEAMWTASKGNAYYILSRQWIAATLNVYAGSAGPTEVQEALDFGEALFSTFTPAQVAEWDNDTGGIVPGFGEVTRKDVIHYAGILADFNEGAIGPGHCDDDYTTTSDGDSRAY